MILFTIAVLTLVAMAIVTIMLISATGAVGIVLFGDVFVFVLLVVLIIRHFVKKKKEK